MTQSGKPESSAAAEEWSSIFVRESAIRCYQFAATTITAMDLDNRQILVNYLERHGYAEGSREGIAEGFDFSKSVYEQVLDDRTIIYQFVRNSSAQYPLQKLGNWFYLQGADMPGLAIFSGGEGRSVATVRVDVRFTALEGTASAMPQNWKHSIGGKGGKTQIFVPDVYIRSNLRILGYGESGCDLG